MQFTDQYNKQQLLIQIVQR